MKPVEQVVTLLSDPEAAQSTEIEADGRLLSFLYEIADDNNLDALIAATDRGDLVYGLNGHEINVADAWADLLSRLASTRT